MYKKIEEEYKKRINIENSKAIELILIISLIVVSYVFHGKWVLQLIVSLAINLLVLVIVYLFWCKNKRIAKKFRIIKNIKNAVKEKQESNGKIFQEILKENRIETEKQLREVMEYYKLKVPASNKVSIGSFLWGIGITLLPILLACVSLDENGIDMLKTIPLLSFAITFIILLVFIIVIVITCKDLYIDLFDKYDVCENFVEMLSWELVQRERKNCKEYDDKINVRKNKK